MRHFVLTRASLKMQTFTIFYPRLKIVFTPFGKKYNSKLKKGVAINLRIQNRIYSFLSNWTEYQCASEISNGPFPNSF